MYALHALALTENDYKVMQPKSHEIKHKKVHRHDTIIHLYEPRTPDTRMHPRDTHIYTLITLTLITHHIN